MPPRYCNIQQKGEKLVYIYIETSMNGMCERDEELGLSTAARWKMVCVKEMQKCGLAC